MVDSGNKNKSLEIVIDSKHYIKKRYSDIQRFFCELKYLKYFKDEDINVPFIYKFDKIQKTIIIDKINKSLLSVEKYEELSKIAREKTEDIKFGLEAMQ